MSIMFVGMIFGEQGGQDHTCVGGVWHIVDDGWPGGEGEGGQLEHQGGKLGGSRVGECREGTGEQEGTGLGR